MNDKPSSTASVSTPDDQDLHTGVDESRVVARVVTFIRNELDDQGLYPNLDSSTELFGTDLLSSMKIGRLLGFLRDQIGVDLPPECIDHETFRTPATLGRVATQHLSLTE